MSEGTIDELVIEVSSGATASIKEIRELSAALSALDSSVGKSATRISSVASSVNQLRSAVSGLSLNGLTKLNELKVSKTVANNLTRIATALSALPYDASSRIAPLTTLSSLNSVKLSSTIPNNIKKIAEAVSTLPLDAATRLAGVTSALIPLKELNGLRLTTVLNTLKKLPEVLKNYETLNVSALVAQLDQLTPRLSQLAAAVNMLKTAYIGMPASLRTVASSARTVTSANKALTASNVSLKSSFVGTIAKIGTLSVGLNFIANGISKCVKTVNDYIENMNLFQASMGDSTKSALEYAQTVQDAMGIDMGEWARNQGVFQTLITGMGETADKATIMSQQLTQLGYDISSFYNISVEDAMLKIQSGIAGELEPLRRLGWDLSDARMQLELTNMGIDASTQSMTQAEKVALRYHLIMTQVTTTHGDMARTIASPANQLRVLEAQVTLAARSIGNLFIPMLNAVLPYVIGFAKAVRTLAVEIANFFGIDATFEVDYSTLDTSGIASGIDDTTDALEDAGSAASDANDKVKELKRQLMGFDEINNISPQSDSSSGGSGGSGADTSGIGLGDIPLDTYDFLDGLDTYITDLSNSIGSALATAFKVALPYVLAIGTGIAAWKIADMVTHMGKLAIVTNPVAALVGIIAGLTVLGAAGLYDMWKNGQNFANVIQTAVSGLGLEGVSIAVKNIAEWVAKFVGPFKEGSLAAGIAEAFGKFGTVLKTLGKVAGVLGTIISIVDGIISITNIFDSISNGEKIAEESMLGLATSALGIGMMFGPTGALVGAIIGAVVFIAGEIYNHWDEICAFFAGIPEWFDTNVCQPVGEFFAGIGASIATFFTDAWNTIVGVWNTVSSWFDTNVGQPVSGFFSGVGESISTFFTDAWNTISGVWSTVSSWFNDNVIEPIKAFFSPFVEWYTQAFTSFTQTMSDIFYNIGAFAQGCAETIQLAWGLLTEWLNTNVVQPVTEFFTGLWNTITLVATNAWTIMSTVWTVVSEWFNSNVVQPVANFFTGLWDTVTQTATFAWDTVSAVWGVVTSWFDTNIIQPVTSVFTDLWNTITGLAQGAWDSITGIFGDLANYFGGIFGVAWAKVQYIFNAGGQIFEGIKEGIYDSFVNIVNSLISGINWVVSIPFNAINTAIGALRSFSIAGVRPFSGLVNINTPQIPYLAEGGQVTSGQLFVARENGKPELVGQMGGKTTVANNEQIVQGIATGVSSAMTSQNQILMEQNRLLRELLSKDTSVTISATAMGAAMTKASRINGRPVYLY